MSLEVKVSTFQIYIDCSSDNIIYLNYTHSDDDNDLKTEHV